MQVKHLYIHIPFCKTICDYCDFVRECYTDEKAKIYLAYICKRLSKYNAKQFATIYIGGGTPNCLNTEQLSLLLAHVCKYLKNNGEFTVECNPEWVTSEQIKLFKKYKVNRISLGVQSTNNALLAKMNRSTNITTIRNVVKQFQKAKINNINVDFMYGFNGLTIKDISHAINFIKEYHIPHVAWYALELKENSKLTKTKYQLSDELIQSQHEFIVKQMQAIHYQRYEVSSWCINKAFQSQHNLAYWNSEDWVGIGKGAYGLEKMNYYYFFDKNNKLVKVNKHYSLRQYYQHILLMGLRKINGIDLSIPINKQAYLFFKNKLKHVSIKNNHLLCNNIDLLDNTLIEII